MQTTRRTFLKSSLALGGASVLNIVFTNRADAKAANTPALILFHAGGGWDTANGLDARLKGGEDEAAILTALFGENTAGKKLVNTIGPFRYRADHPAIKRFLEANSGNLAVFIAKMATNDHGAGTDNMATGSLTMDDPSIGALFAKTFAEDSLPTPFIVAGGSTKTGSLVPVANLGSVEDLRRVLSPNQVDRDGQQLFYPTEVASLINTFRRDRVAERLKDTVIPAHMHALRQILLVAKGKEKLTHIADQLTREYPEGYDPVTEVLLDLINLGMVRSISLSSGGFDTHGQDGQRQLPETMARYFDQISKFWTRAKERHLSGRVLIVGGSEFSRTPNLNGGGGTDHWPGTNTLFLLGNSIVSQMIGASDDAWYAKALDPKKLTPKREQDGGVIPTVADFHLALRQITKIENSLTTRFPLTGSGIDHEVLAKKLTR